MTHHAAQESVACIIFRTDKKKKHASKPYYSASLFNSSILKRDRKMYVQDLTSHRDIKHILHLGKCQLSNIFTQKIALALY